MRVKEGAVCAPRQSCRLGRACVDFFDSDPTFGLVWSSRAEEVRREVVFVMPESRSTRLIPEARDPETQLQFVYSVGKDSCTAFHGKSPTKDFFLRTAFGRKKSCGRLILAHRSHIKSR